MSADNDQVDVLPTAQAGEERTVRLDSCWHSPSREGLCLALKAGRDSETRGRS